MIAKEDLPKCKKCGFPKEGRHPKGKIFCIPCYKETRLKYELNNKEKIKRHSERRRKKHPEKIKKYKADAYKRQHPLLSRYKNMIRRCYNPKDEHYRNWGARGIRVCDRWLGKDGFKNFCDDLYPMFKPGLTLDRFPNLNGNYEPKNVRWATSKEQQNNTRLNTSYRINISDNNPIYFSFGNLTTLVSFAEYHKLPLIIVKYRYSRHWDDPEWILNAKDDDRNFEYKGHMYNMRELGLLSKTGYKKLWGRIVTCGWSVEKAVEAEQ